MPTPQRTVALWNQGVRAHTLTNNVDVASVSQLLRQFAPTFHHKLPESTFAVWAVACIRCLQPDAACSVLATMQVFFPSPHCVLAWPRCVVLAYFFSLLFFFLSLRPFLLLSVDERMDCTAG